jgi:nitrite reductase/ring-hydroxylating ferredoxin subunit
MTSLAIAPQFTASVAPLPAGGPDPDRFDWAEAWYPVAYLDDLDPACPTRFTLLDRGIVIWWDAKGSAWRVFEDQCPHRLAPLSEGRVNENGELECPYHGWAFAGDGACTHIPQQPDDTGAHQSMRACALALPTVMRQGLQADSFFMGADDDMLVLGRQGGGGMMRLGAGRDRVIIGAGTIGPDIGYYLKCALPELKLYLVEVSQEALDGADFVICCAAVELQRRFAHGTLGVGGGAGAHSVERTGVDGQAT